MSRARMVEHGPRCAQRIIGVAECDCGKAEQDAQAECRHGDTWEGYCLDCGADTMTDED